MHILVVKTSSLGDVLHTLPAITDATNAVSDLKVDWLVEESFAEIPKWHPAVNKVIPVALRRWRKNIIKTFTGSEWQQFKDELSTQHYDLIIDAQGLLKSAILTRLATGEQHGFAWSSIREPIASLFYHTKHSISKQQHAIDRVRQLFATALGYQLPNTVPNYNCKNIDSSQTVIKYRVPEINHQPPAEKKLLFLHGTTWSAKHWLPEHWLELAKIAEKNSYQVLLPWGNEQELERAEWLASNCNICKILARSSLIELAKVIKSVNAVVSVDSGLGHLTAALGVPCLSIYGTTTAALTGTRGKNQLHLHKGLECSPCFARDCPKNIGSPPCMEQLSADNVWQELQKVSSIA